MWPQNHFASISFSLLYFVWLKVFTCAFENKWFNSSFLIKWQATHLFSLVIVLFSLPRWPWVSLLFHFGLLHESFSQNMPKQRSFCLALIRDGVEFLWHGPGVLPSCLCLGSLSPTTWLMSNLLFLPLFRYFLSDRLCVGF